MGPSFPLLLSTDSSLSLSPSRSLNHLSSTIFPLLSLSSSLTLATRQPRPHPLQVIPISSASFALVLVLVLYIASSSASFALSYRPRSRCSVSSSLIAEVRCCQSGCHSVFVVRTGSRSFGTPLRNRPNDTAVLLLFQPRSRCSVSSCLIAEVRCCQSGCHSVFVVRTGSRSFGTPL
ncbi:uncharacterized protein J3D65DRAFT_307861 [Phyllosticta citribraziliensis]|uniref:Uncharacterized protein n=1 Tax=Phyllosticta citribraziliensis TaxID=989973 RepID=A0ABR1M147_9PEZI